eukprot:CAMPEP_0181348528 /NCGR_PEP_ID=MMETSP1106-20121128/224_1 /TAXON_ID=81844 /ORGANISM="Mantoniella antarctica, Strain SL-175" /LENGTH=475 /DNA_ID=CAMNT_0023460827 /DNA_START=141 /DNA_END=1568 /DNA_ORIENTATION=-
MTPEERLCPDNMMPCSHGAPTSPANPQAGAREDAFLRLLPAVFCELEGNGDPNIVLRFLRANSEMCAAWCGSNLQTRLSAMCVDVLTNFASLSVTTDAYNDAYNTALAVWTFRLIHEYVLEAGSVQAVEDAFGSGSDRMGILMRANLELAGRELTGTSSPLIICQAVDAVVPCSCLHDALEELRMSCSVQAPGAPPPLSPAPHPEQSSESTALERDFLALSVKAHSQYANGSSTRAHVEIRSLPVDLDDGRYIMIVCNPETRFVYATGAVHAGRASQGDAWREKSIANIWRAFTMELVANMPSVAERRHFAFRPSLFTVRCHVLGRALRRQGGLQCPGTAVKVVGEDEVVGGKPLISIVDGISADFVAHLATRKGGTGEKKSRDAAVRRSRSRPGTFKTDRAGETREVPKMVYACGGCRKLMHHARDALQQCGGCHALRYCSASCQKSDWRDGHKQLCKAIGARGLASGGQGVAM